MVIALTNEQRAVGHLLPPLPEDKNLFWTFDSLKRHVNLVTVERTPVGDRGAQVIAVLPLATLTYEFFQNTEPDLIDIVCEEYIKRALEVLE